MVTMRTAIEQDMPLSDMISRAIDDFGQRSGIRVEYQADGAPGRDPATPADRAAAHHPGGDDQHPQARRCDGRAGQGGGGRRRLVVSVGDNGRGFDPENARDDGLGVTGMEERARLMGGQLHITSAPSDGTVVELSRAVDPVDQRARRGHAERRQHCHPAVRDTDRGQGRTPTRQGRSMSLMAPTPAKGAPPLRVMLVDDHALVRSAVRQAISTGDVELVAEAATAEEAFALALVDPAGHPAARHRPAGHEGPPDARGDRAAPAGDEDRDADRVRLRARHDRRDLRGERRAT